VQFIIPVVEVVHILVSLILVIVVLLQPGKAGDLGSVFGGGTSESVFGASGAVPFLAKLTRLLAVIFFITSLSLGYFSIQKTQSSVIEQTSEIQEVISDDREDFSSDTDVDEGTDVDFLMESPVVPDESGTPKAGLPGLSGNKNPDSQMKNRVPESE